MRDQAGVAHHYLPGQERFPACSANSTTFTVVSGSSQGSGASQEEPLDLTADEPAAAATQPDPAAATGAAAAGSAAEPSEEADPADGDLQMHLAGFQLLRVRALGYGLANRYLMLEQSQSL